MKKRKTRQLKKRQFGAVPFSWQEKIALRIIKKAVSRKNLPHTRSVYLALTELASDKETENFQTYLFELSQYSGVSVKTVSKHLKTLRDLNLVSYEKQTRTQDGKYSPMPIRLIGATVGNFDNQSSRYIESKESTLDYLKSEKCRKILEKQLGEIPNYEEEIQKMIDWQASKGDTCKDYPAKFRNWIRKGREYEKKNHEWYSESSEDDAITYLAKSCFDPNKDQTYHKKSLAYKLKQKGINTDIDNYLLNFKQEHEHL